MSIQKIFLTSTLAFSLLSAHAQQYHDQVVAEVGNKIILQSDIEVRYEQEAPLYSEVSKQEAFCHLIYTSIAEKVLANVAREDSLLMVSDVEIELRVDGQIEASLEKVNYDVSYLERMSGRTLAEIRSEFKPIFSDLMHAENAQKSITSGINITPQEVKDFYNKIPKDSLQLIPATVEIGQIIIEPKVHDEIHELTKERLESIRKEIIDDGKDFGTLASIYSQDGSAKDGGLIKISRTGFDPHFVAAAYRLQPGEISPVTKSSFGYHLIKMEKREGEMASVRHILLIPQPSSQDKKEAMAHLDSIKTALEKNEITFADAVNKYSTDLQSKFSSGMITIPNSQRTDLPIAEIQQLDLIKDIGTMEVGTYTSPMEHMNQETGKLEYRIFYLKSKKEAHTLNLKDDYALIQEVALGEKRNDFLQKYINRISKQYYIKVAPEFKDCDLIKGLNLEN